MALSSCSCGSLVLEQSNASAFCVDWLGYNQSLYTMHDLSAMFYCTEKCTRFLRPLLITDFESFLTHQTIQQCYEKTNPFLMGSIVKKIHEISADFLPKYSLSVTDFASFKTKR